MTDIHQLSLSALCKDLKSGALTAAQVVDHMLARVQRLQPTLRPFAMVLEQQARERAEALDRAREAGAQLGALHGVPIGLKDLLFTRGLPTASGTMVMRDFVPEYDATVVSRLHDAGAIFIGKTELTEGAFGVHHPAIAPPRNPWDVERWPGVSSSGSGVAVAAELAHGALGTDTGGSIRFPSASCGLVGVKPTYGRVSRFGAFALAESLDHIGPMTRRVEDAARMLGVIAGIDANDSTTLDAPVPNYVQSTQSPVADFVVGVDWEYVETGVDEDVVRNVRDTANALQALGVEVREVKLPASADTLITQWGLTTGVECARAHADYFPARRDEYGPVLAGLLDLGLGVEDETYQAIELVRSRFKSDLDRVLEDVHAFLTPCMRSLPPGLEEMEGTASEAEGRAEFIRFTAPFDYSGHPTITLPTQLGAGGMPHSVQLVGARLGEPTLFTLGSALENAFAFDARPEMLDG